MNKILKSLNKPDDEYLHSREFQEDYFKLMKRHHFSGVKLCSYAGNGAIKENAYYNTLSFRILFCEIVYNGIMLFPEIYEYTITVKGTFTTILKIGYCKELDDNGEPCIAILTTNTIAGNKTYYLNKMDLFHIFRANRDPDVDKDIVDSFVLMMVLDGCNPVITTSYKSNPGNKGK
jgi:hypothetical protein